MPKVPSHKVLFDSELHLTSQLKYEFTVHLPYIPLYGIYLDLQMYINENTNKSFNIDNLSLAKMHDKAHELIVPALISDVFFTSPPSRIAMACMLLACEENEEWHRCLKCYIYDRFSHIKIPLQIFVADLENIISEIKTTIYSKPNKTVVSKIDAKLKNCLNPEFIETSELYKRSHEYNNTGHVLMTSVTKIQL